MIAKKICLLGAFSVGKTSLVRRFVHSSFSDRYLTTVGVKIDKKSLVVGEQSITMILWDLHGEDRLQAVRETYLRGSSGALLVADGTRPETIQVALDLEARLHRVCGEVPTRLLINKADLAAEWPTPQEELPLPAARKPLFTSAKSGDNVELAFAELAEQMLGSGTP